MAAALVALVVAAPALFAQPVRDQFQVNTYTTGSQYEPVVAVDDSGKFVVVWVSEGSTEDTDSTGIVGRRYDKKGDPLGGEFPVNTYTTGGQFRPAVAMDADGDFVVVWDGPGSGPGPGGASDTDNGAIHARRFASDGTALGVQFQVNSYTTHTQRRPKVALDDDGDFVVVWDSYGSFGSDQGGYPNSTSIQGQRFNSGGVPQGLEFQVNDYITGFQLSADVALDADGDFVVVWGSGRGAVDNDSYSVQGQRFASDGSRLSDQFLVNTYTTYSQDLPSVASEADGDFIVVWQGYGVTEVDAMQGQRFASDGSTIGGEFQINTYVTTGWQWYPRVSMSASGAFVVVWSSFGSPGNDDDEASVQMRKYSSSGVAATDDLQVNTFTTSYQYGADVGIDANGDFVVVWHSDGSNGNDDDGYGVQARLMKPIFGRSFEDGTLSGWSDVVP